MAQRRKKAAAKPPAVSVAKEPPPPVYDTTLRSLRTGNILNLSTAPSLLGSGAYGSVWRTSIGSEQIVVKQAKLKDGDGIERSIIMEAALLVRMNHPNVVRLLDVAISKLNTALILPLAGKSLKDYINTQWASTRTVDRGIAPDVFKSIILQLARGMAYIQSMDVLNADYKPDNVLIYDGNGCDMRIVITDFGLALPRDCYESQQVHPYFTIWYRAPELYFEAPYTIAADSWALGCIAAELMTGKPPFNGGSDPGVLYLIFFRLGMPDEQSWPGVTRLPKWTPKLLQLVENDRLAANAPPFLTVDQRNTLEHISTKYAYTNLNGARVPLPLEEQTFLSSLLVLDPTRRRTVAYIATQEPYLNTARQLLAKIPCQAAPNIVDETCGPLLARRLVAIQSTSTTIPAGALRTVLFLYLAGNITAYGFPDRAIAVAMQLLDAYTSRTNVSATTQLMLAIITISSIFSSSSWLAVDQIAPPSDISGTAETQRQIITVLGTNLYTTTVYDLVKQYSREYGELMKDASRTIVLLTYNTQLGLDRSTDLVALCCILLACSAVGEQFKQGGLLKERYSREQVTNTIVTFGRELNLALDSSTQSNRDSIMKMCKRGALSTRSLISNITVLSNYIKPEYIKEVDTSIRQITAGIAALKTK